MSYLLFDVETRIDKRLVRDVFFRGQELNEQVAYERMRDQLREETGGDFFPMTCHLPISIAVGSVAEDLRLERIETLCADAYSEAAIVREFWRRLSELDGTLVTFNGRNFDLPVLELQALRLGLAVPTYFNEPRRFRSRGAEAHYDLYDFLSNAGAYRLRGGLDLLSKLAGLPGKSGMDGSRVQEAWEAGRLDEIHRYCREDVLQTYLLLLRVEVLRGRIEPSRAEELAAASPRA